VHRLLAALFEEQRLLDQDDLGCHPVLCGQVGGANEDPGPGVEVVRDGLVEPDIATVGEVTQEYVVNEAR
jgi:hypothetical protein